ncbi:formylglycine-generating enzyme family protein [Paucibacter sp. TC2R-5]|uniref:formylglycine-generating enzyme family protein n=1 Tax=Paucibacter sp. TC2R-5 TaxID=2893555 RepID=UPI0021E40757|nr:formylglycine-generating enzyme family protein [Paucibacter sp. TC2R-5]MCV2358665.1 formylglycine-generating enzyme family protein [Paucibacter sp. TC2R-5]
MCASTSRPSKRRRGLAGLITIGLLLTMAVQGQAATVEIKPRGSQIAGPAQEDRGEPDWQARMNNWQRDSAGEFEPWLQAMRAWRTQQLKAMAYDDAQYRRPELLWTQRNFVQPQAMMEDRYLYDPQARRYTPERYLADLNQRYGGIDSVLLWPVYPNLGIDDRNQWDMLRDLPGGLPALRQLVKDFQSRGVRVLFPLLPWDQGSRDEGRPMPEAIAALLAEIGADGINGDTMDGLPLAYREAADASGRALLLQPELSFKDEAMLAFNQQSWGYWETPFVPMVSKWKWLEPRHLIHVSDRWATDRHNIMQAAFFNGAGIQSWENIWGWWNQFTPRDAEALRRIASIYRAVPDLLSSPDWVPHLPTQHYGVFASSFSGSIAGQGRTLWTLVNRNAFALDEAIIKLAHRPGRRYFDLWRGVELAAKVSGSEAVLSFEIEPLGYGAVLGLDVGALPADLAAFLTAQQARASQPLSAYSAEWKPLPQAMLPIAATRPASQAPSGMVAIPAGEFDFRVTGVEIEGENRPGMDVQYPWEALPRRAHLHRMALKRFFIDRHPVTNAQFKAFIDAAGYRPADAHNFLKAWGGRSPKPGDAQRPVTWVSIEDARAYCQWAGKRLPHEWEWQYAAQGSDGRQYPWGNQWLAAATPAPATERDMPPPAPVGTHPLGASPFGVEDMVGLVWQWTDEFADEHTRAAVLRGGSYYRPQGLHWYFPSALKLNEHGKYLLMAPSKDRAGTIGFRCVMDGG